MKLLDRFFQNNREWADSITSVDPDFFSRLARQQSPAYLWIGCSDSRVPANEIVGMPPGELFVHRNVANLVVQYDFNCLSVIQYAVDVLKVKHIIVCGHYGCGGVKASMSNTKHGLIDNWLHSIKHTWLQHRAELDALPDEATRIDRLCELNVIKQVSAVGHTTVVQDAWDRGQALAVHGWIYGIGDGLLKDLDVTITGREQLDPVYRMND